MPLRDVSDCVIARANGAILSAVWGRSSKWVYRVVGDPPPADSSREQKLRWIRSFYTRWSLPMLVVVWVVLAVAGAPTWALIVMAMVTAWCLLSLLSLSRRIQREHQPPGE